MATNHRPTHKASGKVIVSVQFSALHCASSVIFLAGAPLESGSAFSKEFSVSYYVPEKHQL